MAEWARMFLPPSTWKYKLSQSASQTATLLAGSHETATHLNIFLSLLFLLLACKCCVMRFGIFSPHGDFATFHKKVKKKETAHVAGDGTTRPAEAITQHCVAGFAVAVEDRCSR